MKQCPKCGSELDTGFNCPKCKAKSYKETVSEYNTNGEKIYEKNTVKLVQPDPTPKEMLWWLVEDDCYFKKWYYEKYYILFHGSFYSGDTLTEAVEQAYNKAREAQNERD